MDVYTSYTCPFERRESCIPSILPVSVFVIRTRMRGANPRSKGGYSIPGPSLIPDAFLGTADAAKRTLPAALSASESAGVHHADMAERAVVTNGVSVVH